MHEGVSSFFLSQALSMTCLPGRICRPYHAEGVIQYG